MVFRATGDSHDDGKFDLYDFVYVMQAGRYSTGQAADFSQGDWNGDGFFDAQDFVAVFQAENHVYH